jgi:hypothetical protein
MKFIVGEVVFVLNHLEIDINIEAVEIMALNELDKTYIVRKTTQSTTLYREYKKSMSEIYYHLLSGKIEGIYTSKDVFSLTI